MRTERLVVLEYNGPIVELRHGSDALTPQSDLGDGEDVSHLDRSCRDRAH